MLIIMGGLPKSGKTTIIKSLTRDDILHIGPELLIPGNLDGQPESVKSSIQIAAWESALQKLSESLTNDNANRAIIFDTCGASTDPLRMAIFKAKSMGHTVIYVFIDRDAGACANYIDIKIIDGYRPKLARALKAIQPLVSKVHIIHNDDIGQSAQALSGIIDASFQIRESQPTRRTAGRAKS